MVEGLVIVTRAPLRICLAGGGTDLPAYSNEHGGFCITGAIDKYVYISSNRPPFLDGYAVRYSESEHQIDAARLRHPMFREALSKTEPGIELSVLADVPAGTGLGSSGAFAVALLKNLHPDLGKRWLAEEATTLELDRLQRPVGLQDQYAAAYGGVRCYTFATSGAVTVNDIDPGPLVERLLLFFTGTVRDAATTLAWQAQAVENLHVTKQVGVDSLAAIKDERWDDYGDLLNAHWRVKRKRVDGISSHRIDTMYQTGMKAGALGGKLVGAGGGGFLLFYTLDPEKLRAAMPLAELPFTWDQDGATCMS